MKIGSRVRPVLLLLAAAAILLAGSCSPRYGTLEVTIESLAALNGNTGILYVQLYADTIDGSPVMFQEVNPYSLGDGTPHTFVFPDLAAGTYAVVGFLNAIPYDPFPGPPDSAPSAEWPVVEVHANQVATATITLDIQLTN
jgi:uncharacterized protein (DUF2141 family)